MTANACRRELLVVGNWPSPPARLPCTIDELLFRAVVAGHLQPAQACIFACRCVLDTEMRRYHQVGETGLLLQHLPGPGPRAG